MLHQDWTTYGPNKVCIGRTHSGPSRVYISRTRKPDLLSKLLNLVLLF